MDIARAVKAAYLEYLETQPEPPVLPKYVHREGGESLVYASSLGTCPLAAALKRRNESEAYPLSEAERLSSLHLMRQGVKDAEPIQEALLWQFDTAVAEVPVESEELGVRGRVDVAVGFEDGLHLFEIKRRDPWGPQDAPHPKLSDCYQLLAYSLILNTPHRHILTVSRYFVNVWTIEVGRAGGYVVVDEYGDMLNERWNDEDFLSVPALKAEIERHLVYLKGERNIPMSDFLNHENGWQCYQKVDGGTARKPAGVAKRRCPYWCHDIELNQDNQFAFDYNGGNKLIIPF